LLVDDDNAVREVTATMPRELGYSVVEAGSGGAALDLVERTRDIDLAIVDFAMPGMNGVEVAQQAKQKRPGLPILFITGFVDHAALAGIEEAEILGKPSPLPIWRIRSGSHSRATVKPMWSV
jgi:CheY-like chemotaxis protein